MSLSSALILLATSLQYNSPISLITSAITDLPINTLHDAYLTPIQIIKKYDYPAESHIARTKDGYLLELHRIPYGKAGKTDKARIPVLLFHGFLASSTLWLLNGPEKSLAYRLADEGYDVWMGNMRGNTFSKAHVKYTPSQKAFWDFSFDEIGMIDLPTTIDYILNVTNHRRLYYVGHSAGNSVMFIMTSILPEYNDKIIAVIGLAPPLSIPNTKSPVYLGMVPIAKHLKVLNNLNTRGSYQEPDILIQLFNKYGCSVKIGGYNLCGLVHVMANGWDLQQFNTTLTPLLVKTIPSGTSFKCLLHVLQLIDPGIPARFDYGEEENLERYGTPIPPLYNRTNIKVPVKVYHGGNDIVVTPPDIEALYKALPNPYGIVKIDQFNHMDFVMAIDINSMLNNDVIETMRNITNFMDNSTSNAGNGNQPGPEIIKNELENEMIPQAQVQNNITNLSQRSKDPIDMSTNTTGQYEISMPDHTNYTSQNYI